jgi:hypothetical protein
MRIGMACLAALWVATPAVALAQARVDVEVGDDSYDSTAPGDPVESVDVFYDQLEPDGTWVDEPDVGRVFIPDTDNYVPYREGHWEDTSVGFVWVSNDRHAWATSHYGRWAYSDNYRRWYWLPDTQWGPAWVEWRQTGSDFGWAPLAPEVVVRRGWHPPVESWHYCGAEHILDVHVTRYYEPRERVVVIHREARPIENYANVSNVRVIVGPPRSVLVQHRVVVKPVRVEAHTVGRWTPAQAHAQVARAQEHKATFEVQNQRRIEANTQIHEAHTRVIAAHPQIKVQVDERLKSSGHPPAATPAAPPPPRAAGQPARPAEPAQHAEPGRPVEHAPARPAEHTPARPPEPAHAAAPPPAAHPQPAALHQGEPRREERKEPEPPH